MKNLLVRLSSFIFLTIAAVLNPAVATAEGPQWVEVKSPHFSVVTDAGEKRGREVAMRFEQMRAVFAALFQKANVNIPVPLQIVAFRNSKEMRQFAPLYKGKPTELSGLFQPGEDRNFIMLDMSVENPFNVVFHEYAHQLMNGNAFVPGAPWFDEGFAEYFASIQVDNKEARVGKIPDETFMILREMGWMKVPDLLKVQHYSQAYNENGERRTVFYAESAMVVHYLYDNLLVGKLGTYFDLVNNKGVSIEEAIQQTFGMSAAQFDGKIRSYVAGGQYRYYPIPTPANIVKDGYTTSPVSASEAEALMAEIHLHSPDYQDKALSEFEAILKSDPNSAAAARGLGYGYMRKREFDRAQEYFSQAAKLNSQDPRVHYYSAMLMSRENGFRRSTAPAMIKELEAATALDPNFADAHSMLSFAYLNNGEAEKGLASIRRAIAISPRNLHYYYNFAQILMANRKYDDAIAVLHSLQKSGDPRMAAQASHSLEDAERLKSYGDRVVISGTGSENASAEKDRDSDDESDNHDEPAPETTRHTNVTITLKPGQKPPTQAEIRGNLLSVDCSKAPAAVLTVAAEGKTMKLRTDDPRNLLVTGGKFSCTLANRKVVVNYLDMGDGGGIAMILQLVP